VAQVGAVVDEAGGLVLGAEHHGLRELRTGIARAVDGSAQARPATMLETAPQQRTRHEA